MYLSCIVCFSSFLTKEKKIMLGGDCWRNLSTLWDVFQVIIPSYVVAGMANWEFLVNIPEFPHQHWCRRNPTDLHNCKIPLNHPSSVCHWLLLHSGSQGVVAYTSCHRMNAGLPEEKYISNVSIYIYIYHWVALCVPNILWKTNMKDNKCCIFLLILFYLHFDALWWRPGG